MINFERKMDSIKPLKRLTQFTLIFSLLLLFNGTFLICAQNENDSHNHNKHERGRCHDMKIEAFLIADKNQKFFKKEGYWVVRGQFEVGIRFSKNELHLRDDTSPDSDLTKIPSFNYKSYGDITGYDVNFFLDGKEVYECFRVDDGRDVIPARWKWDTTKYPNGKHTLIINIYDGYDHFGTTSMKFILRNDEN